MKKLAGMTVIVLTALSLVACGSNRSVNKGNSSSKTHSESVAKAKSESRAKKESLAKIKAESESKTKAISESQEQAASESSAQAESESIAAANAAAESAATAASQAADQLATTFSYSPSESYSEPAQQTTTQTQGEINRERGYDPKGNPIMPGQDLLLVLILTEQQILGSLDKTIGLSRMAMKIKTERQLQRDNLQLTKRCKTPIDEVRPNTEDVKS